jgi:polyisoprenyl-phosphate glycosyltransferase
MKTAAIVPAYNEEKNISPVLKVLLSHNGIDQVLVVDGGSQDRTAEVARKLGAEVMVLEGSQGKGGAMKAGVEKTDAEIISFFDADLVGLTSDHVSLLLNPVAEGGAAMSVAVRDRYWGLPLFFIRIDPLLAIAGERAMKRFIFESIPDKFIKGFAVETSLNYFCKINNLKIAYPLLKGLDVIVKEKKWGWYQGFKNRIMMMGQLLKIRFQILGAKKKFKEIFRNASKNKNR